MTDFDSWLATLRDHPADIPRRLVFADWLDENPDSESPWRSEWATFIRWSVDAANCPRADPKYWGYHQNPLEPPARAKELLASAGYGGSEWEYGFPDSRHWSLWGDPNVPPFQSGNPTTDDEYVRRACARRDEELEDISCFPGPIRSLSVSLSGNENLGPPPTWVPVLSARHYGEVSVGIGFAHHHSTLRALNVARVPPLSLSVNPAGEETIRTLAGLELPTLRGLGLGSTVDPVALAECSFLPQLRSFGMGGVRTELHSEIARLPPLLPHVESLSLPVEALPAFLSAAADGAFPELRSLAMPATGVETQGWSEFVRSPAFRQLKSLSWSGRRRAGSGAAVWPEDDDSDPGPPGLTLRLNNIGPADATALFGSPLIGRCSVIIIEGSELAPESYIALAENPHAANLRVLVIHQPYLTPAVAPGAGLAAVANSPYLAGLLDLSLTFHLLTGDDLTALASATFAAGLRSLNLSGSWFQGWDLSQFADRAVMPKLLRLVLNRTHERSAEGYVALRAKFGNVFEE